MMNKLYVVNFNQDLKFTEKLFEQDEENDIDFKPKKCYFDFDNDTLEFGLELKRQNKKLEKIEKIKLVKYDLHFITPKEKNRIATKSSIVKSNDDENDICSITVKANIKDHLLNLFEDYEKEFELSISYKVSYGKEEKLSKALFSALIPIQNQQYMIDNLKSLKLFNPRDIQGSDLISIFDNEFKKCAIPNKDVQLLNTLLDYKKANFEDRFNCLNFLEIFHYLVAIEELETSKALRMCNIDSAKIYRYDNCSLELQQCIDKYITKTSMSKEYKETFLRKIYAIQAGKTLSPDTKDAESVNIFEKNLIKTMKASAKIVYISDNVVLVDVYGMEKFFDEGHHYYIEFVPNRVSCNITHRAIDDMQKYDRSSYLKKFEMDCDFEMGNKPTKAVEKFEWFNDTIKNNQEQQIAVKNIINCTSFPSPFIIFGGPGTGKSSTIVEAISQIVKLKPKSRILVTAGSNSTCDDLGNRLLKYISINKILRIYSPSFESTQERIDKELKRISNFRNGKNKKGLSLEEIATARVVIATLSCTARIVNSEISRGHFDYIFIDEAGSISEPKSYIPFSRSISKYDGICSQIILSGDHKQLGPVVKSYFVSDLGFETSLMERLMNNDKKYQLVNNEYNSKYVVQLKQNYRNHPAIIHFSNVHFYNSKLIPMCSKENKDFVSNSGLLSFNTQFPIIFRNTKFPSEKIRKSLKNEGELKILGHYLEIILKKGIKGCHIQQSDIGIISPYSGQRDRMKKLFSRKYLNIEIGTVDAFQGREKKIIIISCVRSQTSHVGFLSNEKRLNVALTRAKALVVIIGNAETLQKCRIWNKFIAYCRENKAIIGEMYNFKNIGDEVPERANDEEYET